MDPAPREPWCVIAMLRRGHLFTMRLPEQFVARAESHGWVVVIRDSEMPTGPHDVEPSQSNPNRTGDE